MAVTQDTRKASEIWERPVIAPIPLATAGVQNPVISLGGTWKLNVHPPTEFWSNAVNPASWADVLVPGSTDTQGFVIQPDKEYVYKHRFLVPVEFVGQTIILRFDGANCASRVWVNGRHVRNHYGGFTSWQCDITDYVTPGQESWLTVGVTDKNEQCSQNYGGIINDVRLIALPPDHVTRFHVRTDLDAAYRDATLEVMAAVTFGRNERGTIALSLKDPQGSTVSVRPDAIEVTSDQPEVVARIPVPHVQKWDAEHPHLYTLEASLAVNGATVETLSKTVGFRKIEVRKNQVFLNGQEIKLRGVNREDIYPTTGRAFKQGLAEEDARLFSEANVNFIRTSHYPTREDFLDACDRYGIYVEDATNISGIYSRNPPTQNDPEYTAKYMDTFAEMIERDRSHPSIIMWSLANECEWGRNMQMEYDYAKAEDPERLLIYSYPISMPHGTYAYDVWSDHYASWDCDPANQTDYVRASALGFHDEPVLHDEFIHIPCYDLDEKRRDPSVREFWGESVKRFWDSIFATDGALGGAIWTGTDTFSITHEAYRGKEWGIIDGWRREKPEYWMTKKGYSPIKMEDKPVANPGQARTLQVQILNRFDHTNLKETAIHWRVAADAGMISDLDVKPHARGVLEIPARDWQDGEVLNLRFYRNTDILVDEFNLPIGDLRELHVGPQGPAPRVTEDRNSIVVAGDDYTVVFGTKTGLISQAIYKGSEVIKAGPFLNLVGIELAPWSLKSLRSESCGNEAIVHIAGGYGPIEVRFEVRIDGCGLITTRYAIDKLPVRPPRAKNRRDLAWPLDIGGYREVGVAYVLPHTVDRLSWHRKGIWSTYPEDHIGALTGVAPRLRREGDERYGVYPTWPWSEDMRDYYLFGKYDIGRRGTRNFRSTKHNICYASAIIGGTENRVRVESDYTAAVRLEVLDKPGAKVDDHDASIRYVGSWVPMDGEPKSYGRTEMYSNKAGDYAEFTFKGTGIAWIGSKDLIMGKADVYLDGVLEDSGIDLYGRDGSPGEEKIYQQVLFSKEGLADGEHTIKIVATGQKVTESHNAYVSVDAFALLAPDETEGDVRLNINNEWNYPELVWGNYMKPPILIGSGYANTVAMRLSDSDD